MSDTNKKVENTIDILMRNSFWGKKSSSPSLMNNLKNEIAELIQECEIEDWKYSKEEAADVIMIILCILYHIKPVSAELSVDEIMSSITTKLERRYDQIYSGKEVNEDEEDKMWSDSKKVERIMRYMFCDNSECQLFQKVGYDNIAYQNKNYVCNCCNKILKPSKKNVLLYSRRNRREYLDIIRYAIVHYSKGDQKEPELFVTENEEIAIIFVEEIMNSSYGMLEIYRNFICERYQIGFNEFDEFCKIVKARCLERESFTQMYIKDVKNGKNEFKNHFQSKEWRKMQSEIKSLTMDVVKRINKVVQYNARSWNNEVIDKYLLKYRMNDEDHILECMTILHYEKDKIRDLTVELSNMYNCIVGCKFCASGALRQNVVYLDAMDYIRQLNTCLKESGVNPNDFENFYVSFAGIGEPSIVYKTISEGMILIKDMYPHVQFNIATFGFNNKCFEEWEKKEYPIRTLQLPFYSSESIIMQRIVKNLPSDYSLAKNIELAIKCAKYKDGCRVKVNYLAMKGINDSDNDVINMIDYFNKYKSDIAIKISFLNYTKPGEESGIISPPLERLKKIEQLLLGAGFTCYVFGSDINTEMGCGQLVQDYISSKRS